jgi:hypothetical protein
VSSWVKRASYYRIVRWLYVDKINAKPDEQTVFERCKEEKGKPMGIICLQMMW